jgi:hypothetical protein
MEAMNLEVREMGRVCEHRSHAVPERAVLVVEQDHFSVRRATLIVPGETYGPPGTAKSDIVVKFKDGRRLHRAGPTSVWFDPVQHEAIEVLPAITIDAPAIDGAGMQVTARLEGDEIVYLDRYDLGVAVQTDQGLVVPVVRGVDTRSMEELDAEVRRLAEAARSGSLAAEELRGSTFTVTSAGKLAGLFQTPIVNHPEVAILSLGRIADRPVVREGEIVVRPVGYAALTFDHRVVDGARAAEFGLAVLRRLEEPAAS